MTAKQVLVRLKKVRALLAKPEHWCQHGSAIDAHGRPVFVNSKNAVAFCLVGAAWRTSPRSPEVAGALMAALPKGVYGAFGGYPDYWFPVIVASGLAWWANLKFKGGDNA